MAFADLGQQNDPWFEAFDPANRSPNTGFNGGSTPTNMPVVNADGSPWRAPVLNPGGTFSPAPNPTAPSPGGGAVDMNAFSQAWESSPYPGTVDGLRQFMAAHPEYAAAGITLGGSKGDKVYGPGGAYWGDAVIAAGEGGRGKSRLTGDAGAGASGGGGAGGGGTMSQLGYGFGSAMAPWNEQFSAPSADQAMNSPGVQFAMNEQNRMLQNSAAAKGTLLNGRFQQALAGANIGAALGHYGDIYGRAMGEYGLRRENFERNQDRPWSKNISLAQLGRPT